MEVILRKPVKGVGQPGDVVRVSDGHARNYLLPRKLAVEATPENIRILENQAKQKSAKSQRKLLQKNELAQVINQLSCSISKQASDDDKIFGSVSHVDILRCLQSEGIELEKKQIVLEKPIKNLGEHAVQIKLGQGIEATLTICVKNSL